MPRFNRVTAVLLFGLLASGCRESNPAYLGKAEPRDTAPAPDTKIDPVGPEAGVPDSPVLPADVAVEDGPTGAGDAVADVAGPGLDGPMDVGTDERTSPDGRETGKPTDLPLDRSPNLGEVADVAREQFPDARDAADGPIPVIDGGGDGGVAEAGMGIDQAPNCVENQIRACSSPGNPLIGACRAGKQTCTNNAWGPCNDEISPADNEACNGSDDDCNGLTDEGCAAECVVVAPSGDDVGGEGTAAKPFATVKKALDVAVVVDGGAPKRVCVAGGATCDATPAVYEQATSLSIPDGAKVQGNYALANATLTYCPETRPPTTALRLKAAGISVSFTGAVTSGAELGGFSIGRFSQGSGAPSEGPIVGVSVSGSKNVTLSGLFVDDAPMGDVTYGVLIEGGGQATIVGSSVSSGQGKSFAVGVYVADGSVNLRNNCDKIEHGRCVADCTGGGSVLGIRGRGQGNEVAGATDTSSAVFVANKPAPASSIVGNLLCGGPGGANADVLAVNVATLRCEGVGCATVTGNSIRGGTGVLSLAAAFVKGASLIEANAIFLGCGKEGSLGVLLDSSGARLVNNRISGGACLAGSSGGTFEGVRMSLGAGGGEAELHSNDIDPAGNAGECESHGVGIERTSGEEVVSGILRNNIIGTGNCRKRIAVSESEGAQARVLQNNDLCPSPASPSGATTVLVSRDGSDLTSIALVNGLEGAAANLSANPRFVSYPDDLRLTSESPCIDKGTAEGAPLLDADGLARPQGSAPDIGAYEYVKP